MIRKSTIEKELEEKGSCSYFCVGTSMLPLLRQRKDLIHLKKRKGRAKKYDVVLYRAGEDTYILHRVLRVREHDYIICGDNCLQKEYGVTDRDIVGILSGFTRKGRLHSVNETGYRLYVTLWGGRYYYRVWILQILRVAKRMMKKIRKKSKKSA